MDNIDKKTLVCQNKRIITTQIDGEVVMMSIDTNQYIGLNAVGSRIWQLLEQSITIGELIKTLSAEYEIDDDLCYREVLEYIKELDSCKLILLKS